MDGLSYCGHLRRRGIVPLRAAAATCSRSRALTLLSDCPGCGGHDFVRASLFSTERIPTPETPPRRDAAAPGPSRSRRAAGERARRRSSSRASTSCYEEGGELHTVALTREWTRIGRSLAADVRFDDPTVSRRHALIVRQPDGVRVLDDRSLNGVFVNGERVDGKAAERRRRDHRRPLPAELLSSSPTPDGDGGRPASRTAR